MSTRAEESVKGTYYLLNGNGEKVVIDSRAKEEINENIGHFFAGHKF